MRTKEVIFYEATGKQFHRFSHGQKILEAMESYATDRLDSYKESLKQEIIGKLQYGYHEPALKMLFDLIDTPKE